jgi:cytoskeleton protein RodZ
MPDQTVWTESLIRSRADVGDLLRAARESLEVSRDVVAHDLRIRPQYLAAIEEGRFGDLPGPTYVAAFLRSYAGYVGFNPEDIVAAYRHFDTDGGVARPKYKFPVVESERRLPRGAMVLLSVLLLAGAYTAWNFMGRQDVAPPPPVAELPQELRAPAAPPASEAAGPTPTQRADANGPAATAAEPLAATSAQPNGPAAGTRTEAPPAPPHAALPAPVAVPPAPAAPPPAARATPQPPAPPAASTPPPAPAPAAPTRANGPATAPASAAPPPSAAATAPPPQPQQAAPTPQRPAAGPPVEPALPRDRTIRVSRPTILELRDSGSGEVLATVNLRAGDTYTVPSYIAYRLVPGS